MAAAALKPRREAGRPAGRAGGARQPRLSARGAVGRPYCGAVCGGGGGGGPSPLRWREFSQPPPLPRRRAAPRPPAGREEAAPGR
ncbi:Structural maintenance of chromosomes protein 4 [Manis javanica]|nr:Structural maintenance of chromosomes protein 4 [Manis javanica]